MQLTDKQLWQLLKDNNVVSQANLPAQQPSSTWYIRLLLGFSGCVSACFLIVFLGILFSSFLFDEGNISALVFGVIFCSMAFAIFRSAQIKDYAAQVALAFNLCGQLLVGLGLFNLLSDYSSSFTTIFDSLCLIFFTVQLLLVFIMPSFISRVLSSWFALLALCFFLIVNGLAYLTLPLSIILFLGVWMYDFAWKKRKDLWEPIGYGLVLTLMFFSIDVLPYFIVGELFGLNNGSTATLLYGDWVSAAVVFLSFCYLINNIRVQQAISATSKTAISLVLLAVLFAVVSFLIAGASAGLLLVLVGYLKQRRLLVSVGVLSLLGFVSWYYYSLEWTLLYKAIVLIVLAVVFALALLWITVGHRLNQLSKVKLQHIYIINRSNLLVVTTLAIILLVVSFNIYKKEIILEQGRIVLLQLAPVDPRSLMQGDYMRLSFAIERQLLEPAQHSMQGLFTVALDSQQVASFIGLYEEGQVLADNQIKMQFRIRNNRLRLATHAFFFQEGTAEEYTAAVYGEFRVADNGELLLNALRDKDYLVVGYNRPNN